MSDELKNIWKICFGGEDIYSDLYFSRYYLPENTLTHSVNGKPVAMMTLLPATVVSDSGNLKARYVYAVATLPDFRGHGISQQLAAQADGRMIEEDCVLALVVPASDSLFGFYERQGFTTAFFCRTLSFSATDIAETNNEEFRVVSLNDIGKLFALRKIFFNGCDFFVQWDTEILSYIVQECRISGGDVFYFRCRPDTEGYVVIEKQANTVIIKETSITPAFAANLLFFLKQQYADCNNFRFHLPMNSVLWQDCGITQPVAMMKWFVPHNCNVSNAYLGLFME